MLTETSSSQQHVESVSSSSSSASNFNKQQQFHQAQNMAAGQRQHEALANLFRSLSSLATTTSNNNNSNNHHHHHHQYPPQEVVSLNLAVNNASQPMKRPNPSIANSIQSAVAAAVMQQQHQQKQLVTEAISRQQQQQQQHQFNAPNPPQRAHLDTSHQPAGPPPPAYLCDQMKPASNYQFLDQQHQNQQQQLQQPQVVSGLESDVQFSMQPPAVTSASGQQQSQRINYCTICNKELCNKYFMKTHMLKMHGISLEMEQQTKARIENGDSNEQAPAMIDDGSGQDGALNHDGDDSNSSPLGTQLTEQRNLNSSSSSSSSPQKSQQKQASKPSGKSAAQTSTTMANKTGNKTSVKPQATSVLNGFAGNSMGGVVCDICNKELCSKYFLKVHKQNTHGIMTDYQDAGQFVYPFAVNPLAAAAAAANPFMASAMPLQPVASVLPFSTMCFNQAPPSGQAGANSDGCGQFESGPSRHKKARSAGGEKTKRDHKQTRPANNFNEFPNETGCEKALEPFYRLMLAQQQQQHQQQQQQASGFESINQMSAMMCYGAMNPFGPTAGISPAMVVEMILRNQHLFNRNNQQQANQSGRSSGKDKNNNGADPQRKAGGAAPAAAAAAGAKANSKESNNTRYFIHYTEACPMCDRRFKSIKWLKTHMMNDHKQEIGAYMQMMMQSMCQAKGQPAPAIVQDQPFNQPNRTYPMGMGALGVGGPNACNMLAQHQQLDPSPRPLPPPPVPLYTGQQHQQHQQPVPSSLSAQTTGLLQTIQNDHFSLIQNYLDQQRLVLQDQTALNQTALNLSSPELDQNRLATLSNLNIMKRSSSSSSSSSSSPSASSLRSSSAKTSPRSMATTLNDEQQVDQLDLSIKCHNSDSQSCALDNGPSGFLQAAASRRAEMGINELFDDDDDDDCSTRSSCRHEQTASEANA